MAEITETGGDREATIGALITALDEAAGRSWRALGSDLDTPDARKNWALGYLAAAYVDDAPAVKLAETLIHLAGEE